MAQNRNTEAAIRDRHERRAPVHLCRVWEGWKDPESGEWLRTCTIITSEPNELVTQIHPRTPVILPTPVIVNDVRSTLHRVFLLFDSVSGSIRSVHVYNGSAKVQEFNG